LGLNRSALASIITKISAGARKHAERLVGYGGYESDEREHVRQIAQFVLERAAHMEEVCDGLRHHLSDEDFAGPGGKKPEPME